MLADTFPIDQQGRVMGTVLMFHTIGFMLGPILGGLLYDYHNETPFYFCTLFALFTFIGTLFIAEPIEKNNRQDDEERMSLIHSNNDKKKKEWFQLLKHRQIISCIICCFVTSAALSGIEPALPIYLEEKYHVSISTVGGKHI
jgi:MFS family permease